MAQRESAEHPEDSEQRFRAVVESIPDTILILNQQGVIVYANPSVRHLLGYTPDELLGRDAFALVHPDDAGELLAIFTKDVCAPDRTRSRTQRVLRKDGTVRVVEFAGRTYCDRDGHVVAVMNIRDVTERQQVEVKLRAAEARFRVLFESMDEGFALCEMLYDEAGQAVDFRYLEVNPAFTRLTGLPVERAVGRKVSEVIHGIEDFWVQTYARVVRTGQGERVNNPVAALGKVYEVYAWRPEAGRFAVVFSDITERHKAEQALRQSEEHFRRLAESNQRLLHEVNHRVRNNLASLLSLLELIRPKAHDVDAFARAMHDRILAMTRIHNLLAGVGWGDVELRQLIQYLLQSMEHAAPHHVPLAIEGPAVRLHPRQAIPLAMSLLELFANSCKYGAHSAPTGRLMIGWEAQALAGKTTVRLWWRETGGPPIPGAGAIVPSLGTELIQGFMQYELGGRCYLNYPPQGADHWFEFSFQAKETSDAGEEPHPEA